MKTKMKTEFSITYSVGIKSISYKMLTDRFVKKELLDELMYLYTRHLQKKHGACWPGPWLK